MADTRSITLAAALYLRDHDGAITELSPAQQDALAEFVDAALTIDAANGLPVISDPSGRIILLLGARDRFASALMDGPAPFDQPRAWSLPPEPGPEVTTVACTCHGLVWRLRYAPPVSAWEPDIDIPAHESALMSWRGLLTSHEQIVEVP